MSFTPVTNVDTNKECSACFEAFEPNDIVLAHEGLHDIHLACVQRIREQRLNQTPACPLCREKITSVQTMSEGVKLTDVPLPTAAPRAANPLAQDAIDQEQDQEMPPLEDEPAPEWIVIDPTTLPPRRREGPPAEVSGLAQQAALAGIQSQNNQPDFAQRIYQMPPSMFLFMADIWRQRRFD